MIQTQKRKQFGEFCHLLLLSYYVEVMCPKFNFGGNYEANSSVVCILQDPVCVMRCVQSHTYALTHMSTMLCVWIITRANKP